MPVMQKNTSARSLIVIVIASGLINCILLMTSGKGMDNKVLPDYCARTAMLSHRSLQLHGFTNEYPADWPENVSLPAGSQLIGMLSIQERHNTPSIDNCLYKTHLFCTFATELSVDELLEYYRKQFDQTWEVNYELHHLPARSKSDVVSFLPDVDTIPAEGAISIRIIIRSQNSNIDNTYNRIWITMTRCPESDCCPRIVRIGVYLGLPASGDL